MSSQRDSGEQFSADSALILCDVSVGIKMLKTIFIYLVLFLKFDILLGETYLGREKC